MTDQPDDEVRKHYRIYLDDDCLDDDWHCISMANVREFYETEHEALAAARAHRAAVVESSPEVDALRAERDALRAALARIDAVRAKWRADISAYPSSGGPVGWITTTAREMLDEIEAALARATPPTPGGAT